MTGGWVMMEEGVRVLPREGRDIPLRNTVLHGSEVMVIKVE